MDGRKRGQVNAYCRCFTMSTQKTRMHWDRDEPEVTHGIVDVSVVVSCMSSISLSTPL